MVEKEKTNGKKRNTHRIGRMAWGLVAVAAILGLVWAFWPKPVPAEIVVATTSPLKITVDEDGRARVKERHTVSAPLSGSVARIRLRAGDRVKRGDVLARMMPLATPLLDGRARATGDARVQSASASKKQTRSSIERAKIAMEQSEREAARVKSLVGSGTVPSVELERVDLEVRARREELASAELGARIADHELEVAELAQKRIRVGAADEQFEVTAPIDGVVLKVFQESEGVVLAGGPLIELGDSALLEIAVDILTSDAVAVKAGAKVSLEQWGGPPLRAHVRLVEPSAFTKVSALGVEESRVNSILDLDEPRANWQGLGDGYRLLAKIVVWESQAALVVPDGALFRDGGEWALYVVRGGRARLVHVAVGQKNGRLAQITNGLSSGDEVIVHPGDRVSDGVRVSQRTKE